MKADWLGRITRRMSDGPVVMGILNCTPDSFYEGSRKRTEAEIAGRANEITEQGGGIIDVGAFSTRPGADTVSLDEELRRMRRALSIVRKQQPGAVVSVDTFRPEVARMAVEEFGADIINDVSEGGLTGIADRPLDEYEPPDGVPAIFREAARLRAAYVLMSVQPDTSAVLRNFRKEVALLRSLGVEDIILDPGFGFGKEVVRGNFGVLAGLRDIKAEFPDLPLLAGMSRKRMVWQTLGGTAQDDAALRGTMLVNFAALERGADILRVHDVKEAVETIKIHSAIPR